VTTTLVDTGPIVALLNRQDRHHGWAVETFAAVRPPLLTCEAVLSEAAYLLRRLTDGPGKGDRDAPAGGRGGAVSSRGRSRPVKKLLARYRDVPMDLADACLVRLSELHGDCVLLTIDSEFRTVYRRHGRQAIPTRSPD
jgi:predicted nucleic acid-binding protein